MTNRTFKTALYAAGAVALALSVTTASFAQFQRSQTRQNQQSSNPLGDLIGMIANASAKSKAKKGWAQVAPEVHQCVNTMFASQNVKVEQFIAAGMSPTDANMAPIIELCQTVMAAQLKTNFACNVTNAKGQQVATTCSQSYAKEVNGKWASVSRDDFLRAAANDEKVTVGNFETAAAQNARLAEEKRLAQEAAAKEEAARLERLEAEKRFAASPEGKRQAAQRAAEKAARERRELAEAQKRPRIVQALCSGQITHGDRVSYNIYEVNCQNVSAVKQAFLWATRKLDSQGGEWFRHWSGQCANSFRQYNSIIESGRYVETANSRLFYFCNEGLKQGQVK